ncbi:hypothetical protein Sste5346_006506 [Sporothrix stenoceras]|uniref:Phospholipase/carboxylesterase/thioesterase domain-containing protein n=1 Tax=Sporothrix stenoceras TaxID=5173 RepID=A0ABR3Z1D4_9PEZI
MIDSSDLPPPRRGRSDPEMLPTPFVVEPTTEHTHTFILLHGLGSNGHKFGSVLLETGKTTDGRTLAEHFTGARFIFPTARRRRSTAFKRAMLTMWFDVPNLADRHDRSYKQQPGLAESFRYIKKIIDEECGKVERGKESVSKSTVPRQNIILGGLSNGCAMSLICAIALERGLGGIVGLSGWLPFQPQIETEVTVMDDKESPADLAHAGRDYARDVVLEWERPAETEEDAERNMMPVFLAHGTEDGKLPFEMGESARDTMEKLGFEVEWHGYEGLGHWYSIPEEIDDVVRFLYDKCGLPKTTTTTTE